jgi:endonuclease/exonuclease/phosphatase family metal-dependent hydrolase/8-oxo-dGTP pyrophosphatase MutT (NUDIX family)
MNVETINQYGAEYSKTPAFKRIGCRAIIIKENKILLSHEKRTGVYLTPGGGLESGESLEECVIREVREETGYTVKVERPFVKVNEYFYEKLFVSNYFVCEITGEAEQSLTETEIIHGVEPEWVEVDRALAVFGSFENVGDEELAAQYKREFTVLNKFMNKKIKVMTFNIQHCLDYQNNKIDIDLFVDTIKAVNPDICGLNEVRGEGPLEGYTDQANALGDGLGYNRYFAEAIKVEGTSPYGNAFVTKFPIKSAETVAIPDPIFKYEIGKYESRCVLKAVVDANGTDVMILVCHMGLALGERKNAVKTICNIIDKTDMPLILMGDFNALPDSSELKPLFERLNDTDSSAETKGKFTFPSYKPNIKIDYIFYKNLKCVSVETIEKVVSDHYPIVAEFEV